MPRITQRPIVTIGKPIKAKVYRARFKSFEATKYLDVAALKKTRRAVIEIGTVKVPGHSVTLAAEVRYGMITRLAPVHCAGCKAPPKASTARLKKVLVEATRRLEARKGPRPTLPIPLRISRSRGVIGGPIGPIVIIIDEGIPCVWIYIGTLVCIICEFGAICID